MEIDADFAETNLLRGIHTHVHKYRKNLLLGDHQGGDTQWWAIGIIVWEHLVCSEQTIPAKMDWSIALFLVPLEQERSLRCVLDCASFNIIYCSRSHLSAWAQISIHSSRFALNGPEMAARSSYLLFCLFSFASPQTQDAQLKSESSFSHEVGGIVQIWAQNYNKYSKRRLEGLKESKILGIGKWQWGCTPHPSFCWALLMLVD